MTESAKSILKQPYARILIPAEEGGYTAEILEFPGCFSEGDTADEAMSNLELAATNWVQAAQNQNLHIPLPSESNGFGGRIALRLPRSLHRHAARLADRDGVSLNQFIVGAIATRAGMEGTFEQLSDQFKNQLSQLAEQITRSLLHQFSELVGQMRLSFLEAFGTASTSSIFAETIWEGTEITHLLIFASNASSLQARKTRLESAFKRTQVVEIPSGKDKKQEARIQLEA